MAPLKTLVFLGRFPRSGHQKKGKQAHSVVSKFLGFCGSCNHFPPYSNSSPLASLVETQPEQTKVICVSGDFDGALSVLTEMAYFAEERGSVSQPHGKLQGPYQEILAHCEIGRVLLLMLLQPTPQRIRPQHAQILEKYSEGNVTGHPVEFMNKDLFLLLQSVVMVCQEGDACALQDLEKDLWTYLNPEQQHLLHLITLKMSNKEH